MHAFCQIRKQRLGELDILRHTQLTEKKLTLNKCHEDSTVTVPSKYVLVP